MSERIDLITPHLMGKEEEYVLDAIRSNWIAPLGPYVRRFEEDVAAYVGAKYAVALNSGTSAIHLALLAAGVGPGDYVAVSNVSFIASSNPICYCMATPVFIDSEPESFNLSAECLELAAKKYDLKAVVVAHFYGMPADLDAIVDVCSRHNIILIEDAAEALGSAYRGKMAGTFGDIGCFSFNGNKLITASCGGMIVTQNEKYAKRIFSLSTQAKDPVPFYRHTEIGYNYRMSNLCAAIGVAQLENIEKKIKLKKAVYDRYKSNLCEFFTMTPEISGRKTNHWMSCATMAKSCAEEAVEEMGKCGIECRRIWYPLDRQPAYLGREHYSFTIRGEDIALYLFNNGICLPSDTKMDEKTQQDVIDALNAFARRMSK